MSDLTELLKTYDIHISFVERDAPAPEPPPVVEPPPVDVPYTRPKLPAGVALGRLLCDFRLREGRLPANGDASPIGLENWRYGGFRFIPVSISRTKMRAWINLVQAHKFGVRQIGLRILEWVTTRGIKRTVHPFRMALVTGIKSTSWLVCWEAKSGNDQTYGLEIEPVGTSGEEYTFWMHYFRGKTDSERIIRPIQRVVFKTGQAVEVVIRYTKANNADGRIEVWIDGLLTFDVLGRPTDFSTDGNGLIGFGVCCYAEDAIAIEGEEIAIDFEEYEIFEAA